VSFAAAQECRGQGIDVDAYAIDMRVTPNSQSLNARDPANSNICQSNLETGDPIEVLPNDTFLLTLSGYTEVLDLSRKEARLGY
jgi:hypothetical protein